MALNEIIYELINEVNNNNDDISQRELSILNIFKNKLDCTEINFEELIGIIRENGHVWRNIISNFPKSVPINNPINLISMKNYIIYQTKEYPYTILVRFVDNHLELTYIENKDSIPSFTINNPPRKNKNYIYICGIDIYNGYLLTSSADSICTPDEKRCAESKQNTKYLLNFFNLFANKLKSFGL